MRDKLLSLNNVKTLIRKQLWFVVWVNVVEIKAVHTHSLSSSYMGRMAGWHTKAKVRMGTA